MIKETQWEDIASKASEIVELIQYKDDFSFMNDLEKKTVKEIKEAIAILETEL